MAELCTRVAEFVKDLDHKVILGKEEGTCILRMVHVHTPAGLVRLILPADFMVDVTVLKKLIHTEINVMPLPEQNSLCPECVKPMPVLIGGSEVEVIIDSAVKEFATCQVPAGDGKQYIVIKSDTLKVAFPNARWMAFSEPSHNGTHPPRLEYTNHEEIAKVPDQLKGEVRKTQEMPAMPPIADSILKLRMNKNSTAEDLAQIIVKDPLLSAQVMKWARSAFYNYKGNIESVEDAIIKVLGFDVVMNLSLGIILSRTMSVPVKGPIGLYSFWRHAIYAATLSDMLAHKMTGKHKVAHGLIYLGAMLGHFGYLILGELFRSQFWLLTDTINANETIDMDKIDHLALGLSHRDIGLWLLTKWDMPPQVLKCVADHNALHDGNHSEYSNLCFLTNKLLARKEIGFEKNTDIPPELFEKLGLDAKEVEAVFNKFLANVDDLESIIHELT